MYTVLFHREHESSSESGSYDTPSVFNITYCTTLDEVRLYIQREIFEQLRLINEGIRSRSYDYGDYGFAVMENGIVVDMQYAFSDSFGEWDISVAYSDTDDNTIGDMVAEADSSARSLYAKIEDFKLKYVYRAEREYELAMGLEKKRKEEEEKEAKEKKLLVALMAKYPEVR